jgi:hypothetical protein
VRLPDWPGEDGHALVTELSEQGFGAVVALRLRDGGPVKGGEAAVAGGQGGALGGGELAGVAPDVAAGLAVPVVAGWLGGDHNAPPRISSATSIAIARLNAESTTSSTVLPPSAAMA